MPIHDDVTHGVIVLDIFKKIIDLAKRIELTVNFNATTLKPAEKFGHPFSHLFIFGHIFSGSRVRSCDGRNFIIFHLSSPIR